MTEAAPDSTPKHSNIYSALAAAQSEMKPAAKDVTNPHFKSKYADLASVMAASVPYLTKHGIAVLQPPHDEEGSLYVKTILAHGDSGSTLECRIPLIIAKNDMQGYGSAVTYARRYGLMAMAGIAADDDDGNAAAAAAPTRPSAAHMKRQIKELEGDLADVHSEVSLKDLWRAWSSKMNAEQWPVPEYPEDENSYRTVVAEMFRRRKAAFSQDEQEAA